MDLSHLDAIQARLNNEKSRLAHASRMWMSVASGRAKARIASEIAFRQREIASCEKEIAAEYKFLGIELLTLDEILMSDDELLAELER